MSSTPMSLEDRLELMKKNVHSVGEYTDSFINVLSPQLPDLESLFLEIKNSGTFNQVDIDLIEGKIRTIKSKLEAAITEIQGVYQLVGGQYEASLTAYHLSV